MLSVIVLAIVGAIISAVIGTFWYSQSTPMGRLHMKYLGFDKLSVDEQQKWISEAAPHMWKSYLGQMILSLMTAFFTVFVVDTSINNGVPVLMAVAFPVLGWLCFTVPTIGSQIIWGNVDRKIAWQKFVSDTGSILVTILVIAGVTVLFV